jgi:hypothetical protein
MEWLRMKFKIAEEFLFYKKIGSFNRDRSFSFEKNPSQWRVPVRAWVHISGNMYTAFAADGGENRVIHHTMLNILDLPDVSDNWSEEPIANWVAVISTKIKWHILVNLIILK